MESNCKHHIGYLTYIFVWLSLIAFTALTVTVAGVSLGKYTLLVALVAQDCQPFTMPRSMLTAQPVPGQQIAIHYRQALTVRRQLQQTATSM